MTFFIFQSLSTERFQLQEIIADDQDLIYEGLSHPLVIKYYGVSYQTFEATNAQMDFYRDMQLKDTGTWWKIVVKETGERIGAIGYNNYNKKYSRAEVGYWLLPPYWGKGIMKEVFPIVLDYMLQAKKIHRIEAFVEVGNTKSEKLLNHIGFTYEGCLRDCEIKNGTYISLLIYSLLATDVLKPSK